MQTRRAYRADSYREPIYGGHAFRGATLRKRAAAAVAFVVLAMFAAPVSAGAQSSSFVFGVHGNRADDAAYLGASVARVGGFRGSATVEQILPTKRAFDAKGVEIILLVEADGAGPNASEARNLAGWANAFGPGGRYAGTRPVRHIEFGNENSYNYPPKGGPSGGTEYARNYRIAYDAINGTNGNSAVGLLAQADSAALGSEWVNLMFAAEPTLAAMVADNGGWVVHPYGPRAWWKRRLDDLVAQTKANGAPSNIPLFITEWGLASTRDGRCLNQNYGWQDVPGSGGRCMNYQQAATALRSTVQDMRADPNFGSRIRRFMLYSEHDLDAEPGDPGSDVDVSANAEGYFGALKVPWYGLPLASGQRDKGTYTQEVRAQAKGLARPRACGHKYHELWCPAES